MQQTVYLVRHCAYHNPRGIYPGRLPVPLSKDGRNQAVRLRDYFKDKEVHMIYSSAVLRCKQTAEIIADDRISIQYDTRLLETFSAYQGYWALEKDPLASWDDFFSHRNELGGESYKDLQNRMISFFTDLKAREEKPVVICSHGDPLQSLYYHLSGLPLPSEADEKGEKGNPDYQPKGSIRTLKIDDGQYIFQPLITQDMLFS